MALVEAIGGSGLISAVALYFGTFLHEDVAILAGTFLVVEMELSRPFALIPLYLGIVSGDLLLYALGRIARRSTRLQELLIGHRVHRLREWLDRNMVLTIIACRILPGTVAAVFVACGWFGLSLWRFLLTTAIASFIYTTVLFSVVMVLGETIIKRLGYISWGIFGALVITAILVSAIRPNWSLLGRIFDWLGKPRADGGSTTDAEVVGCHGMPPVARLYHPASLAERIPPILFYVPLVIQWIFLGLRHGSLALPTVTDPLFQAGGLIGESKSDCMLQVAAPARKWFAPFVTVTCTTTDQEGEATIDRALAAMARAGLGFPIVAKPDVGWRGFGVRLVRDREALRRYLAAYPEGEVVILQKNVVSEAEVGIFYIRMPDSQEGEIFSLTFRYFPYVIGDGRSSVRQLIAHDSRASWKSRFHHNRDSLHCGLTPECLDSVPKAGEVRRLSFIGSNRVGGLYRDAHAYITPALTRRIDELAKAIPEFYFGRFDARFESTDALMRGEGIQIIEINGAGAEAIHVWDPDMSLYQVYRTLFRQQALMFEIGRINRERGFEPLRLRDLYRYQQRHQRLVPRYPPSN